MTREKTVSLRSYKSKLKQDWNRGSAKCLKFSLSKGNRARVQEDRKQCAREGDLAVLETSAQYTLIEPRTYVNEEVLAKRQEKRNNMSSGTRLK